MKLIQKTSNDMAGRHLGRHRNIHARRMLEWRMLDSLLMNVQKTKRVLSKTVS